MTIEETSLPGVLVITPRIHRDNRGVFFETYNKRAMTEAGLPDEWAQDNFSLSTKNVLRGIHYQIHQPQGKLVRVSHGSVLDVAVETSLARLASRGTQADRYERLGRDFFTRIREGFRAVAEAAPERCVVIDGEGDADAVAAHVLDAVRERLGVAR